MTQGQLFDKLNRESSLVEIQEYISRVIELRGFSEQPVENGMLLLLEEAGELAKAIRKGCKGMSVEKVRTDKYGDIEGEAADVFIVLVSICNRLGIDLFDAFLGKERINCERAWSVNG